MKLKTGDVVMILPHESIWTEQFIGNIGIVRRSWMSVYLIVEIEKSDLPIDLFCKERWAFHPENLLKIGTL